MRFLRSLAPGFEHAASPERGCSVPFRPTLGTDRRENADAERSCPQVSPLARRRVASTTTVLILTQLLNPIDSRRVVEGTNRVASGLVDFHARLGIEHERSALSSKKWRDAVDDVATDARDRALDVGADSVDVAKRLSGEAVGHAASAAGALSNRLVGLQARMRRKAEEPTED